ncbi:Rrf2 family transcriptional regulator [Pontibacillus yanchengensis]|uniref:Rrf2 family transcriptional regulator n=2 Tax=Pontibacillus yanchengensis TaxID=462910 RepID=A0ACC7VGF6_9BACI|nr:Rrf2 family transcriptional regulator [Pontibacillus yanchengensis]MYL34313.1 Rrf2 family transcriptional regulator [Pontibacillus yanchengensis]MYL53782.1 Rrf2 family transcriptional regulator [Pontibacillus yanchengensis]
MHLTQYTDYSLRILMFLATRQEDQLVRSKEIAEIYGISNNHLIKIVRQLSASGYIETIRGRSGGMRLGKDPATINIGDVVRDMEENFHIVECFDQENNECVISKACRLKGVLNEALEAFISVLDKYTLGDMITNKDQLYALLK